jgi:hypothetical protein
VSRSWTSRPLTVPQSYHGGPMAPRFATRLWHTSDYAYVSEVIDRLDESPWRGFCQHFHRNSNTAERCAAKRVRQAVADA